MEKYNLTQTGQEVQNILDNATPQSELTAETERAQEAERVLGEGVQQNATDIDSIEGKIPSAATSENKLTDKEYVDGQIDAEKARAQVAEGTLQSNINAEEARATEAEQTLQGNIDAEEARATEAEQSLQGNIDAEATRIDALEEKVPSGASASNKLATEEYVNESVETAIDAEKDRAQEAESTLQDDIDAEEDRAQEAESTLQSYIEEEEERAKAAERQNADDIDALEAVVPVDATTENKLATIADVTNEANARETADNSLSSAIEAILLLIPSAATSLNKLADKDFVNSSISAASATFRGTYNLVSDLRLTVSATRAQIALALNSSVAVKDNNDYVFVQIPTADATPTQIAKTERFKYNGTIWEYEYDLNNSGYTSAQWAAINSGITEALVNKLSDLPMNADLTTALGVLTRSITTINQKIPETASQANKLVDTAAMESYIVQVLNVLTASFNVTSSDGHVTVSISQVDGKITSFALTTLDIASAASLSLVEGRVTTAEGIISTNSADIAILQDAYAALTQSALVIVKPTDTWPVANPATSTIYRVVDRTNTPPQYYSDYMWNGTAMVLMATYDNAIDPRPKKASLNLVTSGGVFDNIGALDVSELNATENPHTLAQYADLSAALAAIPTDYRKGGMSIKYVQTSDHKYVQYRLMSQTWSTNISNWQSVDFNYRNDYYICSTVGSSVYKTVDAPGFELYVGGSIKVKFEHAHDHGNTALLNINSTGNKTVYFNGNPTSQYNTWDDNEIVVIYYDGTRYQATSYTARDEVFDISAFNDGATYVDLRAAFAGIPNSRKTIKGLTVQFIKRTNTGTQEEPVYVDKIVQYKNTYASGWTTLLQYWIGIEDDIVENSANLAKSGDVYNAITKNNELARLRTLLFQCCSMEYEQGTGSAYSGNFTSGFIKKNFDIQANESYRTTDLITNTDSNRYLYVYAILRAVSTSYYNIALYDLDGNPIEGYALADKSRTIFAIPPEHSARFSLRADGENDIIIGVTPKIGDLTSLENSVDNLSDEIIKMLSIYDRTVMTPANTYLGYIDALGRFQSSQTYTVKEFACQPGQKLLLTNYGNHQGARVFYAFYSSENMSGVVKVSNRVGDYTENSIIVEVPTGANYVCVSLLRYIDDQYLLTQKSEYIDFYLLQEKINNHRPETKYALLKNGEGVFIAYNNHNGTEYVYWFKECMSNNLFTFYQVGYRTANTNVPSTSGISDGTGITWINKTSSDNIGPVEIYVDSDVYAVGGNHKYPTNTASQSYKTAQTDSVKIYLDGKEVTGAYISETRFSELLMCVENTLFDPAVVPASGDTQLSTPMIKEYVSYRVHENNIEVALKHKYLRNCNINLYMGMQSMFVSENYILTPNGQYSAWTATGSTDFYFTKSVYPKFNRFIEKKSDAGYYQSTYLIPDFSLGNHHLIGNNDRIFHRHANKDYHNVINNNTIDQNQVVQWGGSYTFFVAGSKELVADNENLLIYIGSIRGKNCLFINSMGAYTGSITIPKEMCLNKVSIIENEGFVNENDETDNFQIGGDGIYVSCAAAASMILQLD